MVYVPCTILGGLPVIANVWYTRGDGYITDDDAGVDEVFWRKRDGSRGKEVSKAVYDRLEKYDKWWQAAVTEQANDWLGCNCPHRYANGDEEGEWSREYVLLNGRPKSSS